MGLAALADCAVRRPGIRRGRGTPGPSTAHPGDRMSTVAVVAHTGKSIGGGLPELRRVLAREGINDPLWYEVSKSQQAPSRCAAPSPVARRVIFAWGGDGLVQRCIDTLSDTDATLAIVPAGTANLLASNLGIPQEIRRPSKSGSPAYGGGSTSAP